MSQYKEVYLKDVSIYSKDRISLDNLTISNYISTENMLPDRQGITFASSLPSSKTVSRYQPGDILISNIRPYFKKIWFADHEGGCSNDVLVIRNKDKENVVSKYLYYCLFTDEFFDYTMSGAKGAKMPRGDKEEIMKYPLFLPTKSMQERISELLTNIDNKIKINAEINKTLEEIVITLYKHWFIDFGPFQDEEFEDSDLGMIPKGWEIKSISELLLFSKKGITPKYTENVENSIVVINQKCIREQKLSLSKARRHDLSKKVPIDKLLLRYDILINSTGIGTLGRVAQLLYEPKPMVVDSHVRVCRPDPDKCSPIYLGQLFKRLEPYLQTMTEGSTGQAELSSELLNLKVVYPPISIQRDYERKVLNYLMLVQKNENEIEVLSITRDFLVPRLISGEINLNEAEKQVEEIL